MKCKVPVLVLILFLGFTAVCKGQDTRILDMEQKLQSLSITQPGLNQKVETSVSNSSIQEFLKGLASTHNLNINADPQLNQKISSYFSNERVLNVLVFLAKQYNIDYQFTGSIITAVPYKDPLLSRPKPPKIPEISFDEQAQLISFDLSDDSLLTAAKKITALTNKNIVVLPELYPKKVSGYIKQLPLQSALEKLAISNLFKLTKSADGSFIIEPLKQDEELVPRQDDAGNSDLTVRKLNKTASGPSSSTINVQNGKDGKKLITLNVSNSPIKDVIRNMSEQAGINYFVYSDIAGNATANVKGMDFDNALGYILQGSKYTYTVSNGTYMIGERKDEGLRGYELVQLKYRSVDSLLPVIPYELRQGVDIKEFKELNSFLLSGSQPQIKEISEFIKRIDKTVPMVMVEVILIDVKKTKTISTGLKIGVSDSVKTGGTILGGMDFTFGAGDINRFIDQIGLNNVFNIGRVTPNFYASIKALENNSNIDLRQTPKLSTLNGHVATLSIGSTRYYAVTTQNVLGSFNPQTVVTQQFYPVEANLSINVLPFVSGDEQVTMNIDVDISDFLGNTAINVPPPSASSKFKSIIRVKNEEMIVLGGIERNEKSDEGSGTPFLSRIPVLKWFFSSRSKTTGKTVSVVFIKPTIIY